ncbi:MAG: DUF4369 domain-containing protein [Gelidibacter sp.]|nr:DUF4369 domain-containing protein [Gelidibacter sp.]
MKKILVLVVIGFMFSCGNDSTNFTLKGNVKGLKKGMVYLQRVQDSALVTIDSLDVKGNPEFELHTELESPEVLYLKLYKHDNEEHIIPFFADKGTTEINSNLKNFEYDFKIKGSKQQEKLEEYQLMMSRFNNQNLDLIKENFDAQKANDTSRINESVDKYNNHIKRKYLYTINFAINNKDNEIAPYLALTEVYDANIKFLDSINNSLTPEVKASKYGKDLQAFIKKRKAQ